MTAIQLDRIDLTGLPTGALIDLAQVLSASPEHSAALGAVVDEVEENRGVGLCVVHTRELATRWHCDQCIAEGMGTH